MGDCTLLVGVQVGTVFREDNLISVRDIKCAYFSSEILFLELYSKEIIRDKYDLKNSGCVTYDMTLDLPKCPCLHP